MARLIQVIETEATRGNGTINDPMRKVLEYWNANGRLLAAADPLAPEWEEGPGRWLLAKECSEHRVSGQSVSGRALFKGAAESSHEES